MWKRVSDTTKVVATVGTFGVHAFGIKVAGKAMTCDHVDKLTSGAVNTQGWMTLCRWARNALDALSDRLRCVVM